VGDAPKLLLRCHAPGRGRVAGAHIWSGGNLRSPADGTGTGEKLPLGALPRERDHVPRFGPEACAGPPHAAASPRGAGRAYLPDPHTSQPATRGTGSLVTRIVRRS
jgi:hypothetical protein